MFAHIDTWSRKGGEGAVRLNGQRAWTVEEIIAEVERETSACHHVENPTSKDELFIIPGSCKNFDELKLAHEEACQVKIECDYTNPKNTNKSRRMKKLRVDTHTLYTAVISLPINSEDAIDSPLLISECVEAFEHTLLVEKKRLQEAGGELAIAVIHTDEEKIHMHILGLDRQHGSVNRLHPGKAAVDEIRRSNKWKNGCSTDLNRAYKSAMVHWQDNLYEQVFKKFGLLRAGPRRARLSRQEYKQKKEDQEKQAKSIKEAVLAEEEIRKSEKLKTAIEQDRKALNAQRAEQVPGIWTMC
ncbi:hypothetical protein [uncultured Cohaesibacter sp.]|uniref:hypothetical protein n=1 Tax=uncultured Cohaesibacter sp. TaxID=1002546 RepID=UPI0029C7255C|nr:hypothetical protein [uncultured Cohaesibacter sp.]